MLRSFSLARRLAGAASSGGGGVNVKDLEAILMQDADLRPEYCKVKDVSGGCGSFVEVSVQSFAFQNKNVLQQHRMVTKALKAEIPQLHGLTIKTEIPSNEFLRAPPQETDDATAEGKSSEKK